jgi:dipeptidyl aminopeptidase/acylaminoacyl peptidase
VLFTVYTGPAGNDAQIVVQSLETGERRTIIQGAGAGRYVSTGYLVYPAAGTLLAVPFDLASLKIQGKASSVLDGVMPNPGAVSVSRAGSLAYIPGPQKESEPTLDWVDRQGQVQPLNAPPRYYADPRLSPDGRRLAVVIHGEGSKGDIWIYDLGRSVLTRLTLDGNKFRPTWSPDGSRIAFASLKEKAFSLSWIAADGSGAEELLLTRQEVPPLPMSWSQDGFWLAYVLNTPKTTKSDIWILPLRGERRPRLFLQTPFYDAAPRFSPDGRWIVYHSDESGQYEVYVRPFPGPGGKIQISKDGGSGPVWPRNGREVFYQNGDKMMAVDVPTRPTLRPGTPRLLFQKWYEDDPGRRNYDVTSDGQRLLMFQPSKQLSAATQINVVLNWVEELKQKVPTGK